MSTTPLWVPLLIAGLGLLGTVVAGLGGVLLTQRRADRREREAWERETERERERWAREDAARTFEQRRDATVDFYESLREMARDAYDHGIGLSESEKLPWDWQMPTFRKLQHLRVYGSPDVVDAASEAYSRAWRWGHETTRGSGGSELEEEYDEAESILLAAIRKDLSVPALDDDVEPNG